MLAIALRSSSLIVAHARNRLGPKIDQSHGPRQGVATSPSSSAAAIQYVDALPPVSLGELFARLQRAVHVARVEQQEQHTASTAIVPSLPSSTSTTPSQSTSATVIEYVDALPVA